MSKPPSKSPTSSISEGSKETKLDRKYRHSFQPKSSIELPPSAFRHTQSERYDSKDKRKNKRPVAVYQIPSIMEAENSEDEIENPVEIRKEKNKHASVVYENERKISRSGKPKKGEVNSKTGFSFENSAFDGNINTKRNSTTTIRTNSSRAPSLQSLEVVREQYCCCAKRTKCERGLLALVTVLIIIIIVLVIVVVIVAKHEELDDLRRTYLRL